MAIEPVTLQEREHGLDLKGATVVQGFPSVGLVSTIVANYLIQSAKLKVVGTLDHPEFPSLTVVHQGHALDPVRMYGGHLPRDQGPVVVFSSEFQPPPRLVRPIARAILDWAQANDATTVVSPEGIVIDGPEADDDEVEVSAIGTEGRVASRIADSHVDTFNEGIITGVAGVLLTQAMHRRLDALTVLAEAHAKFPDARSSARVVEVIGEVLGLELDASPLYDQAGRFEQKIQQMQRQAGRPAGGRHEPPSAYS